MEVHYGLSELGRQGKSYSFAELAGNAALFTRGVSSEGVFAAESGGDGALVHQSVHRSVRAEALRGPCLAYLLEGVVNGVAIPSSALRPRYPGGRGSFGNIRRSEKLLEQEVHSPRHLGHEEKLAHAVEGALVVPGPGDLPARAEVGGRGSVRGRVAARGLAGDEHPGSDEGGAAAGGGRPGKLSAREHGGRSLQSRRHGEGELSGGARAIDGRPIGRDAGEAEARGREARFCFVVRDVSAWESCSGPRRDYIAGQLIGARLPRDLSRAHTSGTDQCTSSDQQHHDAFSNLQLIIIDSLKHIETLAIS